MTDSEKDRLDRCAAEFMGWQVFPYMMPPGPGHLVYCPPGAEVHVSTVRPIPSPTRDWSAFGELLLWAAGKGLEPEIAARLQDESVIDKDRWWNATLWIGPGRFLTENASDPRVALALAVSAWREGRKGEGGGA